MQNEKEISGGRGMEDIRKLIVFLIINISAFLCYLLGKENFLDLCCRYIGAVTDRHAAGRAELHQYPLPHRSRLLFRCLRIQDGTKSKGAIKHDLRRLLTTDTITYFTELQQYHHRLCGICAFRKKSDRRLLQGEDRKRGQGHRKG